MDSRPGSSASGASESFWMNLGVDRGRNEPLQRQLYEQLRAGIRIGTLRPGAKLPSSRALASEVGCSRNTVLEVLAQLTSEGYLESIRRSGVFIADNVPQDPLPGVVPADGDAPVAEPLRAPPGLSSRGRAIGEARLTGRGPRHAAFSPSMPDVSLFPMALWTQLQTAAWREHGASFAVESDPRGYAPLRRAIAEYASVSRNVPCDPDQVIVTAGSQQAIDLAARLLLDPGDRAWIEDPGYPAVRELFRAAGARVVPMPVDAAGIVVPRNVDRSQWPRVIAVSPAHQFPTGASMTLERRAALLAFAERTGAWIVEDDYDSEFRYEGRPLGSLAGSTTSAADRVIYVGTFSKALFFALRLGYVIVPKHLAISFVRARAVLDVQPSIAAQPALARFIAEGHLVAHVRRMRTVYRKRQEALLAALDTHAAGLFEIESDPAGMHLLARFRPALASRLDDVSAARRVTDRGINVQALSMFYAAPTRDDGFLLGYACADEAALDAAVRTMAAVLRA